MERERTGRQGGEEEEEEEREMEEEEEWCRVTGTYGGPGLYNTEKSAERNACIAIGS